jgi:cyclohexanone monooxygenase
MNSLIDTPVAAEPRVLDAVVVGAGFGGIYALHLLRGQGLRVTVLESGDAVGGTWYHNRYPGARCDIESLDYSYSFSDELQQEWVWTERYASQPEILAYINHVVDRFDLRKDIQLSVRVVSAVFDETRGRWLVTTDTGDLYDTKYCVMATGVLSAVQVPDLEGLEDFSGRWYHSADWPGGLSDFTGDRVALIGTGSSGTQLIPVIAETAEHLTVLQRTPNFCMPARNEPLSDAYQARWKANYTERRRIARASSNGHNQPANDHSGRDVSPKERLEEFERRWNLGGHYMLRAFNDILIDEDVNDAASEFVRDKIRTIVKDPKTAEALLPRMYLGTKRLCTGTDYYETFNRPNVELVDVKANPIVRATESAVELEDGTAVDADVIVFATGFDAMTGSLSRIDIRGRHGRTLQEKWAHGPRTYLGLMIEGLPNLFIVAGPGSPSVFSNMVTSIEQHVEWIAGCMADLESDGVATIEPTADAEQFWVDHVNDTANKTLYGRFKNSWFYGANTPGKPQVFLPYVGGVGPYAERIAKTARDGYEGFTLVPLQDAVLRPEHATTR